MTVAAKQVITFYGAWVLCWIAVAFFGNALNTHSEYAISAHLILSFTGMPLAFLSFHVPNGTVLGTAVAGAIGLVQWTCVAELNGRLTDWWRRKNENP